MADPKTLPPYSPAKTAQSAVTEDPIHGDFYSYLYILWKRKKVIIACIFFTSVIALIVNATQRPLYQSSTEIVLQPKDAEATAQGIHTVTPVVQDPTFLLTQVRLVRGPLLAERVLKKLERTDLRKALLQCFAIQAQQPSRNDEVFSEMERVILIHAIRAAISMSQVERGARIFSLSASGYDPLTVKRLVDAAAESYIELNYESQIESFKKSFSVISKSLSEIREKIKAGELALQKMSKEAELINALKIYGEKHPLVVNLRAAITSLAQSLELELRSLERLEFGQRKDRFFLVTKPHLEFESLLAIELDLQNLKPIMEQETQTNREMYNSIFKKLQDIELAGGKNTWLDAKMIEPAGMPGRPIRPNKKLNFFMAFAIGIMVGVGLAYFLEYLDSSLRSLDDVRSYLKVFPLGMVPEVEKAFFDAKAAEDSAAGISQSRRFWNTIDETLPLFVSEAYRIIRTSLAFGSIDQNVKIVQVTSAVKGEGKTTTVCNVGISLAQAGIKTLLIDADLRRPSLHHILGIDELVEGLSTALSRGDSWEAVVQPTTVTNLFCMPGGVIPPNPSELLSSKRMRVLLNDLREQFDMIILDSPPVISVADAPILASCVEGTILVSRSGFIPRHICQRAKNALEAVNGKIIGAILNGVTSHHQSYEDNRYYGYDSYYGQDQLRGSKKRSTARGMKPIGPLEKLQALWEPFLSMVSNGFARFLRFVKWERQANETSPVDGKE